MGEANLLSGEGPSAPNGWRIEESGRRPSKLLLIEKLRREVGPLARRGYAGISEVTRRLFEHWFEEGGGGRGSGARGEKA